MNTPDLVELIGCYGYALGLGGASAEFAREDARRIAEGLKATGREEDAALTLACLARVDRAIFKIKAAALPAAPGEH